MAWPVFQVSEISRKRLAKASSILNFLSIFFYVSLLILGIYILLAVQEKIRLIEGFNGDLLPGFLMTCGLMGILVGIGGLKICWTNQYTDKREFWAKYLLPLVTAEVILGFLIFISGIICFAQITSLDSSFEKGILIAMQQYSKDAVVKKEIDLLQIEYKCCGSASYKDWFSTNWVNDEYITKRVQDAIKSAQTTSDGDTPFSCCRTDILRPCIHHSIHDNKAHYKYDFRTQLHVYSKGCKDALMDLYGNNLLKNVGVVVFVVSILQTTITVCSRILQTSVMTSLGKGDDEAPSDAYIFPFGSRAVEMMKQGAREFHKKSSKKAKDGGEDSSVPLLQDDPYKDVDTDEISVTGSFDSDFDETFDQPEHYTPAPSEGQENIYDTIDDTALDTRVGTETPFMPPYPDPYSNLPFVQDMGYTYDDFPPPPPPPLQPMMGSRSSIPLRKSHVYVNQIHD